MTDSNPGTTHELAGRDAIRHLADGRRIDLAARGYTGHELTSVELEPSPVGAYYRWTTADGDTFLSYGREAVTVVMAEDHRVPITSRDGSTWTWAVVA